MGTKTCDRDLPISNSKPIFKSPILKSILKPISEQIPEQIPKKIPMELEPAIPDCFGHFENSFKTSKDCRGCYWGQKENKEIVFMLKHWKEWAKFPTQQFRNHFSYKLSFFIYKDSDKPWPQCIEVENIFYGQGAELVAYLLYSCEVRTLWNELFQKRISLKEMQKKLKEMLKKEV